MVCVTDSNVWIDLHVAGLTEKVFQMPFEWIAPDVIIAELEEPDGETLVNLGLQKAELSGRQVQIVADLAVRYLRPSRIDLFALVLAKEKGVVLLTGDHHLREAAEQEKVEVHGTLWLLDQMVAHRIIGKQEAGRALMRMVKAGRRLPDEEVRVRFHQWGVREKR